MDSLSASLEGEQRSKTEALRIKKKLEADINELEIALDHANKANAEGQKTIKRYQGNLRDTIQSYEDESRLRQQIMESVGISERKANALSGEVGNLYEDKKISIKTKIYYYCLNISNQVFLVNPQLLSF